jgi:ribosomal protein L37AE/L43A
MTDDKQFCPTCQQPRPVLWGAYGSLRCLTCGATFDIGESLKAAQDHARQTVARVAANNPR